MGMGVSVNEIKSTDNRLSDFTEHGVYHIIAGLTPVTLIDDILALEPKAKILILGYKCFGRGVNTFNSDTQAQIRVWSRDIVRYIRKAHLSFDNLALEQLDIKRLFTESGWEKVYMGDDFTFSMYLDAVKQEFAPTSRSNARVSCDEVSLLDFFRGI